MKHFLLVCAVLAGCVEGPETADTSDDLLSSNRLSSNALSANRLSSNRLSSNGLAAAASASTLTDLANTTEGRELLTYFVSCALPASQMVVAKDWLGIPWVFFGSLGLAPGWYASAPTIPERHWVSACLLARTNAFGISVPISMRGSLPALAASPTEKGAYPQLEGEFYGDLWADGERPMFTCEGGYASTDPNSSWFQLRKCSDGEAVGDATPCGFTWTGICETHCTSKSGTIACTDPTGTQWTEVVQVYLSR